MSNNNSGTASSGNYIPVNTGNVTVNPGGYITWVPTQQSFTITIGGGGGGGACAESEKKSDEKKKDKGGCSCKKCKEYYDYAEPNQEDGTLICWSCRHGY